MSQSVLQTESTSPEALREFETASSQLPLVCGYVLTYDGKKFLDRCFQTLQQQTDYDNFQLILLDNGSADGSGDYVRENFPGVEILRVFPNIGFAHGANAAIQDARRRGAKHIVFMHDDIAILHSQWLREAVSQFERDPNIGLIGFESVSEDAPQPVPKATLTDVRYLTSPVFMVPVELFDRLGVFDEVYYLASDDDDLGARAQAAGYRTVRLNIPVYHFVGGTVHTYSLKSAYLHMRNGIRFCLKNRSATRAVVRAMRTFDLACNPWPFTFDAEDSAHRRVRNYGNLFVNLRLWLRAVSWNVIRLPQTLRIRAAERRLIRAARIAREGSVAASQIPDSASLTGQLT